MNKPTAKTIANLICGILLATTNKKNLEIDSILTPTELLELATLLENKKLNNQGATQILEFLIENRQINGVKNEANHEENATEIDEQNFDKTQENSEKVSEKISENSLEKTSVNIEEIASKLSVLQVNDDKYLTQIAQSVIENNPKQVLEYREKPQVLNFLVGQCMKTAKGQGNSQLFATILEEKLASLSV